MFDQPAFDQVNDLAAHLGRHPRPWLIGVDVDGTLAPITLRPEDSELEHGAREALAALADTVGVMVAVVSGRPLADLRHKFALPENVILLGSHGAEVGTEIDALTSVEERSIDIAVTRFSEVLADLPGAWIEHKPLAVALHVRQADPELALAALAVLEPRLEGTDGLTLHRGKMVLEAAVRPTGKVDAFGQLRRRLDPATTVFIGDDGSDEHIFRALGATDVAIKVGVGPTAASHRLEAPADAVRLLQQLV